MAHKKKLPGAKRGIRLSKSYGNGISVRYLPPNQAWVVLWHEQILYGPTSSYKEATAYAKDVSSPGRYERELAEAGEGHTYEGDY